ncbi:MAG TPA: D-aminoacyl-tRNA deacylase [Steroidobacteraceae bacterium]|nr:D-aminoacyl-tRNA deacylase [Steroidobacteraceae bacterium]
MIGLLQRVTEARVAVAGVTQASIGAGLVVLIGVLPEDTDADARRLLERLLRYRVFADRSGRMNLSLADVGGELLLVPQFTLAADTKKGLRPGFSRAAAADQGARLFAGLVNLARERHARVQSGAFGAHMLLSLTNDGPVTLWLES